MLVNGAGVIVGRTAFDAVALCVCDADASSEPERVADRVATREVVGGRVADAVAAVAVGCDREAVAPLDVAVGIDADGLGEREPSERDTVAEPDVLAVAAVTLPDAVTRDTVAEMAVDVDGDTETLRDNVTLIVPVATSNVP